jgi:hypothetical protein
LPSKYPPLYCKAVGSRQHEGQEGYLHSSRILSSLAPDHIFLLVQHFLQEGKLIFIRRVPEREIESKGLLEDAFCMGEGFKALFPMIGTDAAGPHPAEGQMVTGHMHNGIIDTAAAIGQVIHHPVLQILILGE